MNELPMNYCTCKLPIDYHKLFILGDAVVETCMVMLSDLTLAPFWGRFHIS